MPVITPFDPWKSKLCTCPFKYSFSPYVGCYHGCLYCYASSYIPRFSEVRVKKDVIKKLNKEISKIKQHKYVTIANSNDPYQPIEEKLKLTREALKIFSSHGFKIMIVTKSSLVLRDLDILKKSRVAISITITTLDENKAKRLEPNVPSPEKRLKTIKILSENNIPTIARIDPIIPLINDEEIGNLVKSVAEAGANHIVSSTYKVKLDSWKRMEKEFPVEMEKLKYLYFDKGERINGYYYLPKEYRYKLMKKVWENAKKFNITFAACREGFLNLNSAKTCDGSHLIL
jgi:DNA repair photolyase